jgi:Carboxypeptidase regulatory-like domain
LPKMDVPISVLNWEVFLPQQYKVKDFGGDVISANLLPATVADSIQMGVGYGTGVGSGSGAGIGPGQAGGVAGGMFSDRIGQPLLPGQLGGYIIDSSGAVITNAKVSVVHQPTSTTQHAATDSEGHWVVSNIPSGPVKVTVTAPGFKTFARQFTYDASQPVHYDTSLNVGTATETVEVTSSASGIEQESRRIERDLKKQALSAQTAPSPNVLNLQRRVSGVLPVSIDVPRVGTSYRFVRPLVLDEETKVTFTYKSKG